MTEYERIHRLRIEHAGALDEEDEDVPVTEYRCQRCGMVALGRFCEVCRKRRDNALKRGRGRKKR